MVKRKTNFVFYISRQKKSLVLWGQQAASMKRRAIVRARPIQRRKSKAIISCALGARPLDCRSLFRIGQIISPPRQFWEKLRPLIILKAFEGKPFSVDGDGLNVGD